MTDQALALLESRGAGFPATYLAARNALARCELVDECKDMANKAMAIEVYARQSKDDSLVIMAQRIQARAIRRMGELLKEIPARQGKHPLEERKHGRHARATEAGLSVHERVVAMRVAAVPGETFEHLVESDTPPPITKLQRMGRKRRGERPTKQPQQTRVHTNCPTCACCEPEFKA